MRARDRILISGIAIAGLALLVAGCGGGGSPAPGVAGLGTTTTAPVTTTTDGFPDPASIGSSSGIKAAKNQIAQVAARDTSSATFLAAQRACAMYYPTSTPPPHPSQQEMQKLLAVSRCMRAHRLAELTARRRGAPRVQLARSGRRSRPAAHEP